MYILKKGTIITKPKTFDFARNSKIIVENLTLTLTLASDFVSNRNVVFMDFMWRERSFNEGLHHTMRFVRCTRSEFVLLLYERTISAEVKPWKKTCTLYVCIICIFFNNNKTDSLIWINFLMSSGTGNGILHNCGQDYRGSFYYCKWKEMNEWKPKILKFKAHLSNKKKVFRFQK